MTIQTNTVSSKTFSSENDHPKDEAAQDSLSVLPLSGMPLKTPGLRSAKLVKNAQLQGMVELFGDAHTGSGQIEPIELRKIFQFDADNDSDIAVVRALSSLPSYDVYSLRLQLRKLNIAVNDHACLRLSDERVRELSSYMRAFTSPLIGAVFGHEQAPNKSYQDLLKLFANPDSATARRNLIRLADKLKLEIDEIPRLMENFGDIYLSLSYYQHCLNRNLPALSHFMASARELRKHPRFREDFVFQQTCDLLDNKLRIVCAEVKNILDVFQARTSDMWDTPSKEEFDRMLSLVTGYQVKIGGALCAISVKMDAWSNSFCHQNSSDMASPIKRADFIMNDMRHGIEAIEHIKYSDQD